MFESRVKLIWRFGFLFLVSPATAAETLWVPEEKPAVAAPAPAEAASEAKAGAKAGPKAKTPIGEAGNLPPATRARSSSSLEQITLAIVQPAKDAKSSVDGLRPGDRLKATIAHSLIAFSDEKTPVLAIVETPLEFRGAKLLGEARLERNSQKIFIEMTRIAVGPKVYDLKAVTFTMEGTLGFKGVYRSREAWYFTGDFIASTVAAYFDGLIPRTTNVFGQAQTDNSVDSAVKKGAAAGAMASAERFREKLKKVPEFCELKGPIDGMVIVQ